jgi:hypothetical protein
MPETRVSEEGISANRDRDMGRLNGPCVPASFSRTLPLIMPRDGAQTLSEVRGPVLSIVCEPCGRREQYDVERLMRQPKLTDLLPALVADCGETKPVLFGPSSGVRARISCKLLKLKWPPRELGLGNR